MDDPVLRVAMEFPWLSLSFGVFLAGMAFAAIWTSTAKQRRGTRLVEEWLAKRMPADQVEEQLRAEGWEPELATAFVRTMLLRQAIRRSEGLLDTGVAPEDARRKLVAGGEGPMIANQAVGAVKMHRQIRRHPIFWRLAAFTCIAAASTLWFLKSVDQAGHDPPVLPTFPLAGFLVQVAAGFFLVLGLCIALSLYSASRYGLPDGKVLDDWSEQGLD